MRERIHTHVKIRYVDAHRLLSHSGLIRVTRRLIVIRKRYDRRANAENHRRMNLAVRVRAAIDVALVAKIVGNHGNHDRLLLERVNVFDHATGNEILPTRKKKKKKILNNNLHVGYVMLPVVIVFSFFELIDVRLFQ